MAKSDISPTALSNDIFFSSNPSTDANDSKTPYSDATNCKKLVTHVKRPMNAFMVWSQIERRKILEKQPDLHNAEVSKQLGQKWKLISETERLQCMEKAEKLRILHSQEFPDYKFQPKKKPRKSVSLDQTPTKAETAMSTLKAQLLKSSYPVPIAPRKMLQFKTTPHETESIKRAESPKLRTTFSNNEHSGHSIPEDVKKGNISLKSYKTKKQLKRRSKSKNNTDNKDIWDNLMNIKITELAIDKSNADEFFNCDEFEDMLKTNNNSQGPISLHLDGCLTSGSIAALACYRDDWAETFDYLTDKVLQSSKNICDEIDQISKKYDELLKDSEMLPADLKVPSINKILGKNWRKPNYGKDFLS